MKTTAIVILNYNGRKHLQTFLPSVVKHAIGNRIIVADNGSTDDSIVFLQERFPEIELLRNTENLGFAGGYNWALPQVKADYFILLNSDVEVTQNWVPPLIEVLESADSIAACQPKILAYSDKTKFEHAGAAGGYIDKFGYPFCRGRIFDTELDLNQYDDTQEIFWATGACLAIKAETFHKMKGFDEDFYAHMEEIDLCWRLKSAGMQIFYTGNSTVYHLGGGTLNKSNPRKTFLNYRNNLFMLLKNLPASKLLPVIFARLCLDGISAFRHLLQGDFGDFWAIFTSHFAFYGKFFEMFRKRSNPSLPSKMYNGSIVYDYFLKKYRTFDKLNSEKFR